MHNKMDVTWVVKAWAGAVDGPSAFLELFGSAVPAYWLDTNQRDSDMGRLSIMGTSADTALLRTIEYNLERDARLTRSPFRELRSALRLAADAEPDIPIELRETFAGGYIGYFGYELKALTGGSRAHHAPQPDALWVWANRFLVIDHRHDVTYVTAVLCDAQEIAEGRSWVNTTYERLASLMPPSLYEERRFVGDDVFHGLEMGEAAYLAAIGECQRLLREGETYEVCLTNRVRLPAVRDPFAFYLGQRLGNPAPFAAFMRFGDLIIASSSPERFMHATASGEIECKPIKGTAPRGGTPDADRRVAEELARDAKTRAENLMIVDLIRNDLARVCNPGSVTVPTLMSVESYETVHQLVTTVRGQLKDGVDAVACAEALFPPGSMTGAPKVRTMEIIDRLECSARGVYSGALGYFAISGGADLSVVIRTAVCTPEATVIGAGGAIVLHSEAQSEFNELLLKAAAPLRRRPAEPATPSRSLAQ